MSVRELTVSQAPVRQPVAQRGVIDGGERAPFAGVRRRAWPDAKRERRAC